jgi:hypothetical protein
MDSKFSEIAQLIGKQLGYNSGDERANDEADVAITYWSEHLESANSKVQARTPLQRLLQEYHMIIDRFIAGLWMEHRALTNRAIQVRRVHLR